jgi:gas vesicle protein
MQKAFNFLIGLLAGAVVGGAAVLLLTPASGRQLRADLENYTGQVKNEIELAAHNRRVEMEEQLSRLRGEIVSE